MLIFYCVSIYSLGSLLAPIFFEGNYFLCDSDKDWLCLNCFDADDFIDLKSSFVFIRAAVYYYSNFSV